MKHGSTLVLIAAALFVSACSSTRATSSDAKVAPAEGSNDAAIAAKLFVLDPRIISEGEGRRLELDLHNRESETIDFLFTIDWFDKSGRPIPLTASGWNRLSLGPNGVQPLRISPMPAQACSWRLRYTSTDNGRG